MVKTLNITEIEINGRIYFIPDKYINDTISYLGCEFHKLYKIMIAMYLDALITNNKIENISKITKNHITDACYSIEKLICYITTGKLYISHLTLIEQQILNHIPESLLQKINPNIIDKIDS